MTSPTSVYLYYDHHDVLIYVGITSRGISRNQEHNTSKSWWKHVTRQEVEHFPDRASAHAREVDLIRRFTPPFNVQHNPSHAEMRKAYNEMSAQVVDGDPLGLARALGKTLPLVALEQSRDRHVFRTKVEHSLIAMRLFPNETKQAKVVLGSERVGHISQGRVSWPIRTNTHHNPERIQHRSGCC